MMYTKMPVEGVIAGLLAEGVATAVSGARQKAKEIQRDKKISEELDPVATEFNEAFGERLKERADDIESYALQSIAFNWDAIADQIDAYEVVFDTEEEAVDWLVEQIVEIEDVELEDKDEKELREVIAEEYADAVESFRGRIEGNDKLQHRFQEDLEMEVLQTLDEISEELERLAGGQPYDLYSYPEDREEIENVLIPGESVEFVDRDEVPSNPEPGRHLVLGPSGSGKTRVIAERVNRLPDDAVEHVLVPEKRLLDPSDAPSLARRSFDGDILLVWQDLHKVEEGQENAVVERVLRELEDGLGDQDRELYALLEARSDRLHSLPGNLPNDFDSPKSFWSDYEPLRVGGMTAPALREIAERAASDVYDIELPVEARDALVENTVNSESAPAYIDAVLKTAGERLTVEDVEGLSDEVSDIWQGHYDSLRDESPEEMDVLIAMKALYDLNVSQYSKLVRAVYLELLDGERGSFRTSVESLVNRQWLRVVGDEVVDLETEYSVHDTQLDAVRYEAKDDAEEVSELLLEKIERTLPEEQQAPAHFYAGFSFREWEIHDRSRDHYEKSIEIDPERSPVVYNNYGLLLHEELDEPEEAKEKYEKAIEIDPEYAEAYNNYGNLLHEELDKPEEAKEKYEKAIEIDPEDAGAYNNYGLLLHEELGEPEEAAEVYEKAIEIDPEDAKAYNNYGVILHEELDEPEEAREKYEMALNIFLQKEELRHALVSLRGLVEVCVELDDEEAVVENCELALNILDEAPHLDTDGSERLWFESVLIFVGSSDEETTEIYRQALRNAEESNTYPATRLFESCWNRRDEHTEDTEMRDVLAASGVVLAAHAEMGFETSYTADEILDSIDSEDVYSPEDVLYEYLTEGETDTKPEELRSRAEGLEDEDDEFGALEHRAFAMLLNALMN